MELLFINSENSRTSEKHRLILLAHMHIIAEGHKVTDLHALATQLLENCLLVALCKELTSVDVRKGTQL